MTDFPDYQEPAANATALSTTSLVGTGLAKESGGNLDTHTTLLAGTAPGALIAGAGRTVGQEVAALIASGSAAGAPGGTPLLHGHNLLYQNTGQVLNPGANFTPPNAIFTKPSYIIQVTAQMSGTNAVMPSVKIHLQWRSSFTGTANVDEQVWFVPAGGSSAQRSTIRGPVLSDTLNITFTNGDATDSVTLNIRIYESTIPASRHDGRSSSNVGLSGATGIRDDPTALTLANDSFTVPASSSVNKTLGLYAGQVNIWINQNSGGGSQVTIQPQGDFNLPSPNPVASLDWTAPPHQIIGIVLPRAWCIAIFTNNAAAPVIATIGITMLEYAS